MTEEINRHARSTTRPRIDARTMNRWRTVAAELERYALKVSEMGHHKMSNELRTAKTYLDAARQEAERIIPHG